MDSHCTVHCKSEVAMSLCRKLSKETRDQQTTDTERGDGVQGLTEAFRAEAVCFAVLHDTVPATIGHPRWRQKQLAWVPQHQKHLEPTCFIDNDISHQPSGRPDGLEVVSIQLPRFLPSPRASDPALLDHPRAYIVFTKPYKTRGESLQTHN